MKNKLIAFNIIAIGLILLYPILEFYCIYYPLKFKFSEIFNQIEYQNYNREIEMYTILN